MKISANAERALHAGMSFHQCDVNDEKLPYNCKNEFDLAGVLFLMTKRQQIRPQPLVLSLPVTMFLLVDTLYPKKYPNKRAKLSIANEGVWNRAHPIFNELMQWDISQSAGIKPDLPRLTVFNSIKILVSIPAAPLIILWHFFRILFQDYARTSTDKDSK